MRREPQAESCKLKPGHPKSNETENVPDLSLGFRVCILRLAEVRARRGIESSTKGSLRPV